MNRFLKHFKFATLPRGAILDIGSGSNPFWRANILMERFLEDDSQRPGKLVIDRPLVCGDICDIPFIDNSFRFIHCSHILEHLDNPEKAICEMTRVSRAGYIETPSEIHEYLDLDFPFHRWAISAENNAIIFREKSQHTSFHPLVEMLSNKKTSTSHFIRKHHSQINILYWFWEGDVKYRIERSSDPIERYGTVNESVADGYAVSPIKSKLKLLLGKLLSPKLDIYEILACPICKRRITIESSSLACISCNKKFPIIDNIPMMTQEHAY